VGRVLLFGLDFCANLRRSTSTSSKKQSLQLVILLMVQKDALVPALVGLWSVIVIAFSALIIWEMKSPMIMRYASALLALAAMTFCLCSYFTAYYLCWEEVETLDLAFVDETGTSVDPFPNCGVCVGVNLAAASTIVLSSLIIADEKTTTDTAGHRNEAYGFAAVVIAGASLIFCTSAYTLIRKGVWTHKA